MSQTKVVIRGAGEMASAVAHRLARCHFKVCLTEVERPLAVRRGVAFCEAVFTGKHQVEGITARLVSSFEEIVPCWKAGEIPLLVDPDCRVKSFLKPAVVIDAILAKKNLGTTIQDAPLVIALGPGFEAGRDCHLLIETNRGHDLGRVLTEGSAEENTGIPGDIGGFTSERVLRAPVEGVFHAFKEIGDMVQAGERVGQVNGHSVDAAIAGVIRGLLRPGFVVPRGLKLGDIDPRGKQRYCFTISDKARAIAGGVLEGIMIFYSPGKKRIKTK